MDNGALVFIIIIEAIVIVWLASKLKQYEKFEHLLGPAPDKPATAAPAGGSTGGLGDSATASDGVPKADTANAASRAVAGSINTFNDEDEELLDMPGVDPEANIEEAKRVQLVMARCRYAEFYLEQLDDDYERGQFQRIVNSCKNTARKIEDPFFQASALHPVIILLDRAEWVKERDQLLSEVSDDLVKQRISEELAASTA
ncbi:MAG: hypothetical protein AB8B64_11375 [Granulosicoccus sp.]